MPALDFELMIQTSSIKNTDVTVLPWQHSNKLQATCLCQSAKGIMCCSQDSLIRDSFAATLHTTRCQARTVLDSHQACQDLSWTASHTHSTGLVRNQQRPSHTLAIPQGFPLAPSSASSHSPAWEKARFRCGPLCCMPCPCTQDILDILGLSTACLECTPHGGMSS